MSTTAVQDWAGIANELEAIDAKRAARAAAALPEDVARELPEPGRIAWQRGLVDLSAEGGRLKIGQGAAQIAEVDVLLRLTEWFVARLFPTRLLRSRQRKG